MMDLERLIDQAASTLNRFRLDRKMALVVGGSRGLGQAMAMALSAAGAEVCVVGRSLEDLKKTTEAISKLGRRGKYIVTDVTQEEEVERMAGQALKSFGRIDILVNSQGNVHLQPSIDFNTEAWQKVIDVNLKSVFLCCKHVGRVMLDQGKGKIINISSVRGFQGRAEDLAYAPSKGGVNQLTRSLAIEWGPKGINVNAIAPGLIWTPRTEAYEKAEPGRYEKILNRLSLRRWGKPEDLIGTAIFLASEPSDYLTGQTIFVGAGWTIA